jgi:hypothetical protein
MARMPGLTAAAALGSATGYYQSGVSCEWNAASRVIPQERICGTGTGVWKCLYQCCDITYGPYGVPILKCDPSSVSWVCGHSRPPDGGMIW